MADFTTVKQYLIELGLHPVSEDTDEQIVVVQDEASGLVNLIIDCEDPILVIEQPVLELQRELSSSELSWLLKSNRELVHGAWCLDEEGKRLLFRDTLQLEHLDLNELEASIVALRMAFAENADKLIAMAKGGPR